MKIFINPSRDSWQEILARPAVDHSGLRDTVSDLLKQVKSGGDKSLFELTRRFDGIELTDLQVLDEEMLQAEAAVSPELKKAISTARQNIEKFHEAQQVDDSLITTTDGVKCWTRTVPVEKVGLYIPGGTAPLFSTVLMLGIPAMLAGCTEVVLCTPPGADGKVHPAILYCARILGIEKIFRIGGAQAIAAMAYGTESIPRVDKIFGPGNKYVTVAKQMVSLENIAIDLPAGPSEVAVMADETADPAFVAADLLSQAEHGTDSQVLLVSTDAGLIEKVKAELAKQLKVLPRKKMAEQSLLNSRIVVLRSIDEAIDMINEYAPEHLIISCRDYGDVGIRILNAGSVFMGPYTPESAGDYASGTNHTLPTGGYARVYSGLGLTDFQKKISFQEISKEGLQNLGPSIMTMAAEEELEGHSMAVKLRLSKISNNKK
ncbi:MAG TPA: histidinol dehydrogenase [Bacteroides sp.]|nr:histidinol dehydrogenase [Bacteroides sp.]